MHFVIKMIKLLNVLKGIDKYHQDFSFLIKIVHLNFLFDVMKQKFYKNHKFNNRLIEFMLISKNDFYI